MTTTCIACTEAIAESLVRDLAKGGNNVPLTKTQETMGVPKQLVYIAGLVFTSTTKDNTTLFCQLQELYHACLGLHDKKLLFQWSPTLVPCPEALNMIAHDVQLKREEMNGEANKIAEELLEKEEASKKKKKSRKKKQALVEPPPTEKKKTPQQLDETKMPVESERPSAASEDSTNADDASFQHQEQVLSPTQVQMVEEKEAVINTSPDSSWVQVKTKCSQKSESSLSMERSSNEKVDDTIPQFDKEETVQELSVKSSSFSSQQQQDSPKIQALEEQVRQLQLALEEKESLLEQQRQAHLKQMQQEREATEERMQALQLRLYISETQSRTFEEALQQHVKAVQENVARTPTKEEEEESFKPLYSRVANDNKSQV